MKRLIYAQLSGSFRRNFIEIIIAYYVCALLVTRLVEKKKWNPIEYGC
ncbi:hypothetical protein V7075_28785 [Neobacillus drentensis]